MNNHLNLREPIEKSYNEAISAATAKMRKIKNIIYQAGFEFGLEKAQVIINHKLNRLKVSFPNSVLQATVEIEDGAEVLASTDNVAEQTESQWQ